MVCIKKNYLVYQTLKNNINWLGIREILLRVRNYETSFRISFLNYLLLDSLEDLFYDKFFFQGFTEKFQF